MTSAKGIARPAAATVGRATETGVASRQTTTSTKQDTTSDPARQIQIADLLQHGQQNAVPLRELVQWTGIRPRDLRRRIETERRQGTPILSDCEHGYFLPGNRAELAKFVRSMRNRAEEIKAVAAAVEQAEV